MINRTYGFIKKKHVIDIPVCYLCMSMGIMFTWPSSTLKLFESNNTTLHRPMNPTELALFGSLSSIGALISTPIAGFSLDRIGRRWSAIMLSLNHIIAWALVAVSKKVEVVLFAIFLSGIGGGVFLIVPVFVSEFCQENIRGAMTSGSMIFYAVGMLVSYLLGGTLNYFTQIYVYLSISVAGSILLAFLKESPTFLLQRGLEEDAKKSVAFYRSVTTTSKEVIEEINAIKRALNPDMDDSLPEEKHKVRVEKPKESLSAIQFLRKSASTRRAFLVALTLVIASIFQGLVVVQVFAEPLFEEAVPTMSPTVCSIVFAILAIVAGLVAAYLTELAGRRALMIYASTASGLACMLLGSQIQLKWAPHAFTAVCIYAFTIFYTLGAGTIPYVVAAEVFLPEIKSLVTMVVIEVAWLCNFIILFIFTPLVNVIGLGPVFYLFSAICFSTAVFSMVFLPETKGLTVDAIQILFTSKKKRPARV